MPAPRLPPIPPTAPPSPPATICDSSANICGSPVLGCFPERSNVHLDLSAATIGHSNLGGLGPDFGASPTLLYRSVGFAPDGRAFDLVVSNLTKYAPRNTATNGITNGHFGEINMDGGQQVKLLFTIRDSEHGGLVTLNQMYFSLFDIDESFASTSRETLWLSHFDSFVHSADTEVEIVHTGSEREVQLMSTQRGVNADNPTDASSLTDLQRRRSVQFSFSAVSSFTVVFAISLSSWGRSFYFSGDRPFELPTCTR